MKNTLTISRSEKWNFDQGTNGAFCGRESKTAHVTRASRSTQAFLTAGLLSLLVFFVSHQSLAQNEVRPRTEQTVKGIVLTNEGGDALAGATVMLKGSTIGIVADSKGMFEFPQKVRSGEILLISFVGFETQEYIVPEKVSGLVEIRLTSGVVISGDLSVNDIYTSSRAGFQRIWAKVRDLF